LLTPRSGLVLALALTFSALAGGEAGVAQAPKIQKPRPAPTKQLPPLPPATIDDQLAIGGQDIKARKVNTRMTVEVNVNGRGPYRFLVDSGADTSVVGMRIAAAPWSIASWSTSCRLDRAGSKTWSFQHFGKWIWAARA
jgi:hypothetical protein